MFDRYTEGSRRVIFFARYEASSYGSPFIETEHLLLALFREDRALTKWFPGDTNAGPEIRAEIERRIPIRERISTSVEVPLSQECKKVLILASEVADRLGHRHIEPVHLLLGILRLESSQTAQMLVARGLEQKSIVERLAKPPSPGPHNESETSALLTLESFLSGLKSLNLATLLTLFGENAEVIDAAGKRWNRDEIRSGFETLFASYGKKNATYTIEATLADTREIFVASVRWNNALVASEQRAWMHRMSVVLIFGANGWEILLAQLTAVDFSAFHQAGGPRGGHESTLTESRAGQGPNSANRRDNSTGL